MPLLGDRGRARFSATLFVHQDGVVLAMTLAALEQRRLASELFAGSGSTLQHLVERTSARAGYLHAALRGLASQGWVDLTTDGAIIAARPTELGRRASRNLGSYLAC